MFKSKNLLTVIKTVVICLSATIVSTSVQAAELSIVTGSEGRELQNLRASLDLFESNTDHTVKIVPLPRYTTDRFERYSLWLTAQNEEIDLYLTEATWAPQLADHMLDLAEAATEIVEEYFPQAIASQTVDGRLVAMPLSADAPALFYRKDLLEKHVEAVPSTWSEMAETARIIQDAERLEGNKEMVGFVFQGALGEDLTSNALEWIKSHGGGQIVESDGTISINNTKAAAALKVVGSWIGFISPQAVLGYSEEDARSVWQAGNSIFFRGWSREFDLGNSGQSLIKDKFEVTTLPVGEGGITSAATLGGTSIAVSRYTKSPDEAKELAMFLSSNEIQKQRAIALGYLPSIASLYNNVQVTSARPIVPRWKEMFRNVVPRPAAATRKNYDIVSQEFWTAVHETLSFNGSAEENVTILERRLKRLKASGWR
ncbi:MAG: ABC transporter substrate-binding protein [Hyphomicrobiales bacterium]